MIHEIKGNLLDASISGANTIMMCHQVNCKGIMGAGLARAVRERWPRVYEDYAQMCHRNGPAMLGSTQFYCVKEGFADDKWRFVANMFAQDGYGRDKRYTNYEAFASCCKQIVDYCEEDFDDSDVIAMPKYIGCGLAGGDWGVVRAIIESELKNFNVWLYEL